MIEKPTTAEIAKWLRHMVGCIESTSGLTRESCTRFLLQAANELERLWRANTKLEHAMGLAQAALNNIATNYDCDGDGHKYRTGCRACDAAAAHRAVNEALTMTTIHTNEGW